MKKYVYIIEFILLLFAGFMASFFIHQKQLLTKRIDEMEIQIIQLDEQIDEENREYEELVKKLSMARDEKESEVFRLWQRRLNQLKEKME